MAIDKKAILEELAVVSDFFDSCGMFKQADELDIVAKKIAYSSLAEKIDVPQKFTDRAYSIGYDSIFSKIDPSKTQEALEKLKNDAIQSVEQDLGLSLDDVQKDMVIQDIMMNFQSGKEQGEPNDGVVQEIGEKQKEDIDKDSELNKDVFAPGTV